MSKPRLEGKTALITGAASGIGRAAAKLFLEEGARIAVSDLDFAGLEDFDSAGAKTFQQDVADETRWREVVDATVEKFGRLDILVNNAGIAIIGNIEKATLADFRKTLAVNVESVFLGCREAVRVMKSVGRFDRQPVLGRRNYRRLRTPQPIARARAPSGCSPNRSHCIARAPAMRFAAIRCIPRSLRRRWWKGLSRLSRDPDRVREGLRRAIPMGRFGEAEEIAAAVLYLASDESAFVTGAEIVLDGGLTAQ